MFKLNEEHLNRLYLINSFLIPNDELIFFGFRGCLPVRDDDNEFREELNLQLVDPDYLHPKCTIGQWRQGEGIALFPGSTIPHRRYVADSIAKNGKETNQLMTGFYNNYRQGVHLSRKPTGHKAFRQSGKLPIRRTADDFDFDEDDRVEFTRPFDNIHAAWSMGIDDDKYASAGCQVIVGFPKCRKRTNQPDTGPWKTFRENAYNISQTSFSYILLNGRDAQKVALNSTTKLSARLRYGSKGDLVSDLQRKLKDKDLYEGDIDGDFGSKTLFAVLGHQTVAFGPDSDDGIVGPITAGSLDISLPEL